MENKTEVKQINNQVEYTEKKNILSQLTQSLFAGQSKNGFIELFRYALVGCVAFCVDVATLFILTHYLGIYYLVSAGIAFVLGLTVCYILNVKWVFVKRNVKNQQKEIIFFIGLGLNQLFIGFFTESLDFHYLISKVGATILVFVWNFTARKFLLFR
jgi:putative flippase GtrA